MLDWEVSCESSGSGEPPIVRRMEVVSGPFGRRRWSGQVKSRIIEETLEPGANIAEVARRHGLVPQQLYAWRSAARARAGGMGFVPIELERDASSDPMASGCVVVVQAGDMAIHIPAGAGTDHIGRVLLAVRQVG